MRGDERMKRPALSPGVVTSVAMLLAGCEASIGPVEPPDSKLVGSYSYGAAEAADLWSTLASVPVLDQFQLDGSEQNQAICCNAEFPSLARGQTFTVGVTGVLSGLELSLYTVSNPGDLVVAILDMSGGDPRTAPVLGSLSVTTAAAGPISPILSLESINATFIDLTPLGIAVEAGDVLAFRLTVASPLPSLWAIQVSAFTDRYLGGSYFAITANNSVQYFGDAAFKIFVLPSQTIGYLVQRVAGSSLSAGEKTSLTGKLTVAEVSLARDASEAAINQLEAFIKEVRALQRSGRLDDATAGQWIAIAQAIMRDLSV